MEMSYDRESQSLFTESENNLNENDKSFVFTKLLMLTLKGISNNIFQNALKLYFIGCTTDQLSFTA